MGTAPMSAEALRAALGARAAALDIACVAETGSTNADLLEQAAVAGRRPHLLVAERQSAGRGRRGRPWYSTAGASLTFSLSWPLRRADLSGLSLATGVAVADAIDPAHRPERHVALKWPNDLWLAGTAGPGGKLGGILIETTPIDESRLVVIGIGLNLLEQRVVDASSGLAWLRQLDATAGLDGTLVRVVAALMDALGRFEEAGLAPFVARFAARDLLCGRPVRCSGAGDADGLIGIAAGISATGELRVRSGRGIECVGSGEVSVRLADEAVPMMAQQAGASC